eukprot:gene2430-4720_t
MAVIVFVFVFSGPLNVVVLIGLPRLDENSTLAFERFLSEVLLLATGSEQTVAVAVVHLSADDDGRLRGCGFVSCDTQSDAQCVAQCLDGFPWPTR